MCYKIVVNKGEKEIETPQEFLNHFGFEAPKEPCYKNVIMDSCLCQVDVEKAFKENDITFTNDCGDYYI